MRDQHGPIPEQPSRGDTRYQVWTGGVLVNGQDPEAERRAQMRSALAEKQRQEEQAARQRAERRQKGRGQRVTPPAAAVHPEGLRRLLEALGEQGEARMGVSGA